MPDDQPFYPAVQHIHRNRQAAIAEEGQSGLQGIGLGDLAAANLVEQLLQTEDALAFLLVVRDIVYGKHIDIHADLVALRFLLDHLRPQVNHLGEGVVVVLFPLGIQHPVAPLAIVILLQEPLVVGTEHIDVDVVVPGDIALVAHGPDEGTA